MPNRVLRDWTDSDRINQLSAQAERLFTRLIMKADDYGRYFADAKRLKAFLFPLRDDVSEADISGWLADCEKAGIIRFYESDGKRYLQIWKYGQRLRNMRNVYPSPIWSEDDVDPPAAPTGGGQTLHRGALPRPAASVGGMPNGAAGRR
jgi:hypothetical protein